MRLPASSLQKWLINSNPECALDPVTHGFTRQQQEARCQDRQKEGKADNKMFWDLKRERAEMDSLLSCVSLCLFVPLCASLCVNPVVDLQL